jgi:hypothetical protein
MIFRTITASSPSDGSVMEIEDGLNKVTSVIVNRTIGIALLKSRLMIAGWKSIHSHHSSKTQEALGKLLTDESKFQTFSTF